MLKPALAAGERDLFAALFKEGPSIELDDENHAVLGAARTRHKRSLEEDYKQNYFKLNGTLNIPGIVIVLGSMLIALNIGRGPTPFVIAAIALSFLTMAFFAIIMKRPTLRGRKILDEMMGFRDFLEIAEKDELNLRNPPQKTPELFEAFLPFALALGVDQRWSERFALRPGIHSRSRWKTSIVRPGTTGSWNSNRLSRTTNKISRSLNSAISSSVTPPGSSSGGGGGGSSGGGGGGGGGGGW